MMMMASLALFGIAAGLEVRCLDASPWAGAESGFAQKMGVATVTLDEVAGLGPEALLVVPGASRFPARGVPMLREFLARGGHVMAAGEGAPFTTALYEGEDGRWMEQDALLRETPRGRLMVEVTAPVLAKGIRGSGSAANTVEYIPSGNGYTASVVFGVTPGWETMGFPCAPASSGDDVLRFRAQSTGQAEALLIEVREKDGSRWMTTTPVPREMGEVGVHQTSFTFWRDSSSANRGGEGDHLHLDQAETVSFGFAQSHQMLKPGQYGYTVDNIGAGAYPGYAAKPEKLIIEGIAPSYKLFEATPARCAVESSLAGLDIAFPAKVTSPVARPLHRAADRPYVWQPLAKAYDADGRWTATPIATTWIEGAGTATIVGFMPEPAVLGALAAKLALDIPAGYTPPRMEDQLLTPSETGPCVTVADGHFMLEGERWFPNGVNFWPLYSSGMESWEYFLHWTAPHSYVPELVDQDLSRLAGLGVNLISVQYSRPDQAPQLRDVVARCAKYGIKVNISFVGAHPTQPADDDISKRSFPDMLRAANLAGNPTVFAYDLAWEPNLGRQEQRKALAPLWNAWTTKHYGSVDRAEKLWGMANRENGALAGPTDEQIAQDGPHRVMVAAYRRFADDLISTRYREVIRVARTVDDTHLFGVRTGYGGTGSIWIAPAMPFQVTSGAAHLDFISPEGYGYDENNIAKAALVTQYCRWAGNGKPVFWAELGLSVLGGGDEALDKQRLMYQAFASMIAKTSADGWSTWWHTGGFRVDENSDYGIISPDGTPRPATQSFRVLAGLEGVIDAPLPAGDAITVNRDADTRGIAAIVENNIADFARIYDAGRLPVIVTKGSGTTTETCPFTAVGGAPFEAPAPAEFVNGEVQVDRLNDSNVRITLINTGEAAWTKKDVSLRIHQGGSERNISVADTPRYGRFVIEAEAGPDAVFALVSQRFGVFGE